MHPSITAICEKAAVHWNLDLNSVHDLNKIAQNVLQLSDFFIDSPDDSTPWGKTWAQQAYMFYYLPLNSLRVEHILKHIENDLAKISLSQVIDFGAGLATASRLLLNDRYKMRLVEHELVPQELIQKFDPQANQFHWTQHPPVSAELQSTPTMSCFSYSLTELKELPPWAWESRALLIIEPSTQQDGRKLMQLREQLISKNYEILAPCTHQLACPLLHQSKNDWCHDRVHTQLPKWMQQIEEALPMKNRTLTMSYVFAVQKKFAPEKIQRAPRFARIVGDLLKEKGKDRQLVCRSPEREYFAWMHKHGEHPEIPRGVLVTMPENLQKVANELRVPAGTPISTEI